MDHAGVDGYYLGLADAVEEMDMLNQSALQSKKQLSAAEDKLVFLLRSMKHSYISSNVFCLWSTHFP